MCLCQSCQLCLLHHLHIDTLCPASATDQSLSCRRSCLDCSLWQPQQHENTHYRAVSRRARDTRSEWGTREVLSVGGKWGWTEMILITVLSKFYSPRYGQIGNMMALCLVLDSWFPDLSILGARLYPLWSILRKWEGRVRYVFGLIWYFPLWISRGCQSWSLGRKWERYNFSKHSIDVGRSFK